jgi:GT2 family glycosyltransferase
VFELSNKPKVRNFAMEKQLNIVFCLPGETFSGAFLECWSRLVAFCMKNNIQPILSRAQSCNIYYVRNMCLEPDIKRGPGQKPFDGKIDYDYIMWIDSDIMFTTEQFMQLLSHGSDIVSGVYLMQGGREFATVKDWDEEYFKVNGSFRHFTPQDLEGSEELIEVAYTGMGFMLMKKGVMESLEYPWFKPIEKCIGSMVDFTTEDVSFCLRAKEAGWRILIDPAVKVGHEKKIVL